MKLLVHNDIFYGPFIQDEDAMRFLRMQRQYPNITYSTRQLYLPDRRFLEHSLDVPYDSWFPFQYYMSIVLDHHADKYWGPFISRKDAENFHAHLGVFDIILLNIFFPFEVYSR